MKPLPSMRPLFLLTHEFWPRRGGIATYCEEMARAAALAAGGRGVEVWAPALRPGEPERAGWPFAVRRLPLRGTHDLGCRLAMARFLVGERRRLRRALVHLAEPGPMLAAMLLQPWRTFCPQRMILTFHGSEVLKFHADPVIRLLARRLIRRAWRVSTLTQYARRLLCECFPEAAGKVVLAPGALRSGWEAAGQDGEPDGEGERSSGAAGPDGRRLVVLTVGRLHPRKGQAQTLAALAALPEAWRRRVEYRMAGTTNRPGYEAELREAARRAEAEGLAVRFLGDVPDGELGAAYAEADIFALTSVEHGHSVEGFGLVYLEASAHGLPVVAHAIGGVAEAVHDGETGLLVRPGPGSGELLTEAFARLLGDAALRRRLGAAGRAWARKNSWADSARVLYGEDLD